jgi:hypothetical protein
MWLVSLQLENLLLMIGFVLMLAALAKLAYGGAE